VYPMILYNNSLCNKCAQCIDVCDVQAISLVEDGVRIDRGRCVIKCTKCVDTCDQRALSISGKEMTVREVLQKVIRDRSFYQTSGGGITASGGEALMQSEFVEALFNECKKEGIHTCLDTSGYAHRKALERVLNYTDLVLFDLKLIESLSHRKVIGKSNRLILQNAEIVVSRGIPLIFRIPLIPSLTDSDENLIKIVTFVKTLNLSKDVEIDLMPYHLYGIGKYNMIGRSYKLAGLRSLKDDQIQSRKALIESFGIVCKIV